MWSLAWSYLLLWTLCEPSLFRPLCTFRDETSSNQKSAQAHREPDDSLLVQRPLSEAFHGGDSEDHDSSNEGNQSSHTARTLSLMENTNHRERSVVWKQSQVMNAEGKVSWHTELRATQLWDKSCNYHRPDQTARHSSLTWHTASFWCCMQNRNHTVCPQRIVKVWAECVTVTGQRFVGNLTLYCWIKT